MATPKNVLLDGQAQPWLGGSGALLLSGTMNGASIVFAGSDDGTNWVTLATMTVIGIYPFIMPQGTFLRCTVTGSPTVNMKVYSEANCWVAPASSTSITGGGDASNATQLLQLTQETAINSVLGVKTDAKSAATDGTSISHTSILKQLSAYMASLLTVFPATLTLGSGVKTASTLQVVLATDQPALTAKLLVTPDSVALPANQSCNTAQINGVTPLMGNGASGTGAQRVTIANDSTGQIAVVPGGQQVEVIPTVTAGAYTAGFVVGGIMTFANILPANFIGVLESITLKFKGSVQTGEYDLFIFNASPAGGTYADHGAPTFNSADQVRLLGGYALTANKSGLGTHTVYNLDGIAKAIIGTSTSLFAVLIAKGATTNNLASTTDVSVILGVL